jgi:hypothetical protein
LKLAHKDMRLATELGRELDTPMRLANMAFAEMPEALNRGWEKRDSRSPMLLQLERCGLKVRGRPQRIQEVLRPRSALHAVMEPKATRNKGTRFGRSLPSLMLQKPETREPPRSAGARAMSQL